MDFWRNLCGQFSLFFHTWYNTIHHTSTGLFFLLSMIWLYSFDKHLLQVDTKLSMIFDYIGLINT